MQSILFGTPDLPAHKMFHVPWVYVIGIAAHTVPTTWTTRDMLVIFLEAHFMSFLCAPFDLLIFACFFESCNPIRDLSAEIISPICGTMFDSALFGYKAKLVLATIDQ